MHLIIVFGPPAVGKMTVGRALADLTGLRLFHNHMAIEPVLQLFEFDSPPFARLVRSFRQQVFREVAESDLPGLIYTCVWDLDDERDRRFIEGLCDLFRAREARVHFVELQASLEERLRRNRTPERLGEKRSKRDLEASERRLLSNESRFRLNTDGDFPWPEEHVRIDNTDLSPGEVARRIAERFDLAPEEASHIQPERQGAPPGSTGDVDFGRHSEDYARYRPGFPSSFYDRLGRIVGFEGVRALDLATGPGVIALELAARGAHVTGIDVSENQVAVARRRADERGLSPRCRFLVRPAEDTGLVPRAFDAAVAGQCWHWFDETAVLEELLRVLRPGGHLVVANDCYLPRHSPVARATEELILEHNPTWTMAGHSGLFPGHVDALIAGGFELVEQFSYDHDVMFTHTAWRGRMRTCNGVGSGPLSEAEVARFDEALGDLLRRECPREPFPVRHRVWATVARRP